MSSPFLFLSVFLLSGCATIFGGRKDEVEIRSSPSAQVHIDDRVRGQTPLEVDLDARDSLNVLVTTEGYTGYETTLETGFRWSTLLNLVSPLTGGPVGLVVDVVNGAAKKVEADNLNVSLAETPPPGPEQEPVAQKPSGSGSDAAEAPSAGETEEPRFQSVVDTRIPETSMDRSDDVAVVIGNKAYRHSDVPDVDYALRDARIMKKYLVRTLGFREENVIFAENAGGSVLTRIFGTDATPEGQLYNWVRPDESDVFVYYSGHGAPDPDSEDAYLVATDTDPNYLSLNGYPLHQLYENLAQIPAASVTVVLEACFSGVSEGGQVLPEISPAVLTVENPVMSMENGLAFTAGAADQVSSWYGEMGHGLFTYYFLAGLRGAADADGDRAVTAREMKAFLSDEVPYRARRMHNREQTPQVVGQNKDRELVRYEGKVPAQDR